MPPSSPPPSDSRSAVRRSRSCGCCTCSRSKHAEGWWPAAEIDQVQRGAPPPLPRCRSVRKFLQGTNMFRLAAVFFIWMASTAYALEDRGAIDEADLREAYVKA